MKLPVRSRLRPARRRPVPVKHRCRVAGLRSCRWGDDLQGRLAAAIPLAFFVLLFRSKCELFLIGGFRPIGRVHFLCSAKENEPKERRTRRLAPPHTDGVQRGSLRSSEKPARAQLADLADARFGLEQGARLPRFFLRCSAAPTGPETTCLISREAQGTRVSGQAVGRLSLWVLSLGRARESTSPEWAKPTN